MNSELLVFWPRVGLGIRISSWDMIPAMTPIAVLQPQEMTAFLDDFRQTIALASNRLLEIPEVLAVVDQHLGSSAILHLQNGFILPPSAAPEWLRVGWSFEITATSAPASKASIAARIPARPAPTTTTSCFASTAMEAT